MRYFNYLSREEEEELFFQAPRPFDNASERQVLAHAVGAALYCPATRHSLADEIRSRKIEGLTTMVIDLEDAIGDNQIEQAERSLLHQMERLASYLTDGTMSLDDLPLLFIRVRSPEQLKRLIAKLEDKIGFVCGFALPKFAPQEGAEYFEAIAAYNRAKNAALPTLYGMPILETASILYKETRMETLYEIKRLLDAYSDCVLNVRIGATDFSSLFGLRRSPEMTIYDIAPIRDCIGDILNLFGRMDSPYVISGPVWEYFSGRDRVLKPQLRQTPFEETFGRPGRRLRMDMLSRHMDGLIREVMMDKENGIVGKTVIHPTHVKPVQSLYAVTHEEYMDATSILSNNDGSLGVLKSEYANKMNEIKPHLNWARRILIRSSIYGVLHEHKQFISLLPEHEHAYA